MQKETNILNDDVFNKCDKLDARVKKANTQYLEWSDKVNKQLAKDKASIENTNGQIEELDTLTQDIKRKFDSQKSGVNKKVEEMDKILKQ